MVIVTFINWTHGLLKVDNGTVLQDLLSTKLCDLTAIMVFGKIRAYYPVLMT